MKQSSWKRELEIIKVIKIKRLRKKICVVIKITGVTKYECYTTTMNIQIVSKKCVINKTDQEVK